DLLEAVLAEADLRGAFCAGTNFFLADLRRANCQEAILRQADLQGGDLREADLRRAQIQDARLGGAELKGALLQGADLLDSIGLTADQAREAVSDGTTRLPEYLR
ncbi:MAG: pentapeptide repeat-containing protein, partial [Gemmatimonadota bacterium]